MFAYYFQKNMPKNLLPKYALYIYIYIYIYIERERERKYILDIYIVMLHKWWEIVLYACDVEGSLAIDPPQNKS